MLLHQMSQAELRAEVAAIGTPKTDAERARVAKIRVEIYERAKEEIEPPRGSSHARCMELSCLLW